MKKIFYSLWAQLVGTNPRSAPVELISQQLREPRPLPVGAGEFDTWADRIVSGACLPADPDSQKFAIASMVLHLGPTESHKEDAYFIHSLRKSAANQVAHAKMEEIRTAAKARLEEAKKAEATEEAQASAAKSDPDTGQ